MIFDHNSKVYRAKWKLSGDNRFNGAYYYSKEIVDNIIPRVKTDRSWVTINAPSQCEDGAIVFIHNNNVPGLYDWLEKYDDLILVCGIESTCEKVAHLGTPIYLPLSIDVEDVKSHEASKTKDTAFVGRKGKRTYNLPQNIDYLEGMPRELLLDEVAKYKKVYAVGRCAIEAIALGCEVLPYDDRYPDTSIWKVMDNKEAAKILQAKIDEIDGITRKKRGRPKKTTPSGVEYEEITIEEIMFSL